MEQPSYETINPKALNTKQKAVRLTQKYYRSDEKCEHGHAGVRFVSNDACFYCVQNATYQEYWAKKRNNKKESNIHRLNMDLSVEERIKLDNLRKNRAKAQYRKDMHEARYESSVHYLIDEALEEKHG